MRPGIRDNSGARRPEKTIKSDVTMNFTSEGNHPIQAEIREIL